MITCCRPVMHVGRGQLHVEHTSDEDLKSNPRPLAAHLHTTMGRAYIDRIIDEEMPKVEEEERQEKRRRAKREKKEGDKVWSGIRIIVSTLIMVVVVIILIAYLVLRPTKPHFSLQDATVYQFNVTSPNTLLISLQVTLFTKNPNGRIGIFYRNLDMYVSYRNQQITLPAILPPTYLGHDDISAWSPFLYGDSLPVSPYTTVLLDQDMKVGSVIMAVKVNGHLKWQVGSLVFGRFQLHVSCPVNMEYIGNSGNAGSILRLPNPVDCTTTV